MVGPPSSWSKDREDPVARLHSGLSAPRLFIVLEVALSVGIVSRRTSAPPFSPFKVAKYRGLKEATCF